MNTPTHPEAPKKALSLLNKTMIKMRAKTLVEFFDIAGAIFTTNPVIPILDNILIREGQLVYTDLQNTVLFDVDYTGEPMLAPFRSLKFFVDTLNPECEVVFEVEEDEVTVSTDFGHFSYEREPVGDYPATPTVELRFSGELTVDHVKNIKTCVKYVSTDELRPAMTGVQIGDAIASTDGHILCFFDEQVFEGQIILPSKTVSLLGEHEYKVNFNDSICRIKRPGVEVVCRLIDERFPDWRKVIPEPVVEFNVPLRKFEQAINRAGFFTNPSTRCVEFKGGVETCFVFAENDYLQSYFRSENIPSTLNGEDVVFRMNCKILHSVLQSLEGEEVTMKFTGTNKALLVGDNFMIMPIQYA